MKRKIVGIFVCTLVIASAALPVIGTSDVVKETAPVLSVVDQQQNNTAEVHWLDSGVANWQQFVNHGNMIEKVDCHIGCYYTDSADITLSIEKIIGTALTSITYPATALPLDHQDWFTFDFPDVNLTYGETYHIVIRFDNESEYAWSGAYGDPYPLGLSSRSAQWDYAFKTIVDRFASPALEFTLTAGLGITLICENHGSEDFNNRTHAHIWIDGGLILVNEEWAEPPDVITPIPAGERVTLAKYLVIGFGPCVINLEVNPFGETMSGNTNAFIILFFILEPPIVIDVQ